MRTTCNLFFAVIAAVFLFAPSAVRADQASEFADFLGQCYAKKNPFQFYGWMKGGITVNNHGNTNSYGAPKAPADRSQDFYSGNSYLLMTEQQSDIKLSQLWLGVTKAIDTSHGFDWGFQGDYIYGTDAKYTQNFGDKSFDHNWGQGDYYSSIAQLYGEAGYCNLKFKAGKFAPGMVHETLAAPATFFNSAAYICYNTPLTVNGVVAEYKVNNCLSFNGGWTAGYHSAFDNRFGDNAFLGGATLKTSRATALRYHLFYNDNGNNHPQNRDSELIQTLIFTYNINRCWFYMIEGLYVDNDFVGGGSTKAYGINQHLIYTLSPKWSVGLRGEWHHADGTLFDALPNGGDGGDIYALTLGANWNACQKITIRPEMRYDWTDFNNGRKLFGNGEKDQQLSAGGSVIMRF